LQAFLFHIYIIGQFVKKIGELELSEDKHDFISQVLDNFIEIEQN